MKYGPVMNRIYGNHLAVQWPANSLLIANFRANNLQNLVALLGLHFTQLIDRDRIQQMEEQFLMMPFGDAEEVHIVPRAVVNDPVSIGAWLVSSIGGVNFAAAVGATGVMIANWVAAAVVSFAISAVAGAVLNALSPKPKSASPNEKRDSHLLTNAPNYVEEGGVVPVIFGETEVSSTLINFGTYAEEMPLNE